MIYDLRALGIEALNAMQEEMLEAVRRHDSVVLLSPTGSGKTLGYMLPVLEAMQPHPRPTVLILVPSRELAIQTQGVASALCRDAKAYACYGGRPAMDEHRAMRNLSPQMIVGTPGRILDHLQKGNFEYDSIDTLVIDEFDKSLELGFRQQMADILALLPSVRKRILLSATDSTEIPAFVGTDRVHRMDYLTDTDTDYADRISQYLLRSPEKDKLQTLGHLLCSLGSTPSIVFLNYREAVDRVYQFLHKAGFCVSAFHGAMEQKDRERALFRFQSGCANVLVSTDLAARGLDLASVENIIHYHLPMNNEAYIHRNGRTEAQRGRGILYHLRHGGARLLSGAFFQMGDSLHRPWQEGQDKQGGYSGFPKQDGRPPARPTWHGHRIPPLVLCCSGAYVHAVADGTHRGTEDKGTENHHRTHTPLRGLGHSHCENRQHLVTT